MTGSEEGKKKTILVIEDDLDFSEYITAVLNDHGYETEVAMDGAEAFERAKAVRPEGITLDILLPGRTGIAIYRSLRKDQETRSIPVVVLTGVGTEGKKLAVERFFRGRAVPPPDFVLQKPVEPEALIKAVDEALGSKAA
jgi:CheY-like chemotaxis protein